MSFENSLPDSCFPLSMPSSIVPKRTKPYGKRVSLAILCAALLTTNRLHAQEDTAEQASALTPSKASITMLNCCGVKSQNNTQKIHQRITV